MKLTLLPVMRPVLNAREIIKQSLLLEDHLFNDKRYCRDCIAKGFLFLEAFAEEAITLECHGDKRKRCPAALKKLPSIVRALHHAWASNPADKSLASIVAQRLRKLRKQLMKEYATLPIHTLPDVERSIIRRLKKSSKNAAKNARKKM